MKTYPNPSTKYREIVCTAGIDQDTGKLIRLYPIQFTSLALGKQFEKWQFVDVRVRKARNDHRSESFEVEQESITPREKIATDGVGWTTRWAHIEHLISPSREALEADDRGDSPSLGIIKPSDYALVISPQKRPEFTAKERRKILGTLGFDTLFGDRLTQQVHLEKIPLKFQYRYTCGSGCQKWHTSFFEDWEIGEAWRKWRLIYTDPALLQMKIIQRFAEIPKSNDNLYLVLGTHSRFRNTWLAIGHFQPRLDQRFNTTQLSFDFR